MSTKIYNGFIFREGMTLDDIHRECEVVRGILWKHRVRKEATYAVQKAVAILDARTLGLTKRDERPELSPFSAATMALLDGVAAAERTMERGHILDFKFEIVAIPLQSGRILGLTYTQQRDWEKLWMALPFVSDYHYQNQADPPPVEEVSVEEWEQRRKDWDEALVEADRSKRGIPALCGITFTLCLNEGGTWPKVGAALKFQPKLENRVEALAFDMLWMEYAAEQEIDLDKKEEDAERAHEVLAVFSEYRRWVKKPEGEKRLKAKRADLRTQLIHPVTADDLQPPQEQRRAP